MKAANTPIMIAAAAVMTWEEPMNPLRTDSLASPVRIHSSRIRETRNTW